MKQKDVVIVGAGFGGIGMGHKLKQAGFEDFVIIDKNSGPGGTWRTNTYPGAECDIPSFLYSYSFGPKMAWTRKWSGQEEILAYVEKCVDAFGIRPNMRFGNAITSATFDTATHRWRISLDNGEIYECRHFISSIGQLHVPNWVNYLGQDKFHGPIFHSAEWDHSVDLKGKRIGVIGNAASALQFIPEVAKQAGELTVYQRTANWVLPKGNKTYSGFVRAILRHVPGIARLYRHMIWAQGEHMLFPVMEGSKFHERLLGGMFRRNFQKQVKDLELREALTPPYPLGARRVLLSDNYYDALTRDNVDLVTDPIDHFDDKGIVTKDGQHKALDMVILGTGFQTNPFLQTLQITGRTGRSLREHWGNGGARAYLGIAVPEFPNLHLMYGPNTNSGHTSMIIKLEAQIDYIVKLIKLADKGAIEVTKRAADAFDEEMQTRLSASQWNKIGRSYYKDGDRITANWPGSSREYQKRTERPDHSDFELVS
ncbi:MAG: NAD(P)/FAD-dependent oxidoreductase [Pseudomonadota bacterium]